MRCAWVPHSTNYIHSQLFGAHTARCIRDDKIPLRNKKWSDYYATDFLTLSEHLLIAPFMPRDPRREILQESISCI